MIGKQFGFLDGESRAVVLTFLDPECFRERRGWGGLEQSDQDLIDATLAGDPGAYDILMKRYERLVFKVAYGFGRNREAALDITQNALLKAYNGLGTFRRGSQFKTWLDRIAYNEGINWRRSQRRHEEGREAIESEDRFSVGGGQESELIRQERQDRIRKELRHLKSNHRLAVTLRYFEGMSVREVAKVLRCSEGTVKSILFRSVRHLRDALAE